MNNPSVIDPERPDTVPVLEAVGLEKTFRRPGAPELTILSDLSLAVPRAGSLVICGASGSGKTTLLNLLGGLDRPTRGEIRWSGEDVSGWSRRKRARARNRQVAYVFQGYHLLPELDVLENVLLARWIRRAEDRSLAESILDRVGLADRLQHRPFELSGGEQQRVAVARALYQNPQVILADEPTGNLDRQNSRKVVDLLRTLCVEEGKALLLVTHDFSIAAGIGKVCSLVDGKLEDGGLK